MALLMLPRVVLTHLKAGLRAALRPAPVMIGWWTQPALPTAVKQCRPSLTTVPAGWKLRCAKLAISARRKPFTRRNLKRIGLRSGVVSTAPTIGVFDLDPSRQALCGVPLHHRLYELVLDLPGGGLGDAKPAAQLNAGDAALALSEVVHGAKPSAQRHLGRRENRSGDHRCLPSTGGTLLKRPGLNEAVMLPCANRADKAGWPAPAHHRLPALILCSVKNRKLGLAEPLLKLHLVARHRSNPQKQPYVPVLYHDLIAEDSA